MTNPVEAFFEGDPNVLDLFQVLSRDVLKRHPDARIQVQKSQISFRGPRPFCAAWLPIRRGIKGRPDHYLVVSFGLNREIRHPRIVETAEPHPGRWTHHTIVACDNDIDDELMGWIDLAFAWKNGPAGTKTET